MSRGGYQDATKAVMLTADTTADVVLQRIPLAKLDASASLMITPVDANTYSLSGTVTNSGDASASQISGTMTIRDSTQTTIATLTFGLPPGTTIAPAATVTYVAGTISRSTIDGLGARGGYYSVQWTFTNGC